MKIIKEKTLPAGVVGVVYGPEGIGKTSLAAALDRPLFIDAERGARGLDVDKVDEDVTLEGILRTMQELVSDHMGYRTLVVDTADCVEAKLIADFCSEQKIDSIEKIPYGKGYTMCAERFCRILEKARRLADSGMDVVFVCHAEIRKFEMPDERGSYDRWNLKLTKQTAPKMKEAVDWMVFVNYRTNIVGADKSAGETKSHATGGRRWCYTNHTTAFDAKKRVFMDLPDDCPLDDMAKALPKAIRKAVASHVAETEDNMSSRQNTETKLEPKHERKQEDAELRTDPASERPAIARLRKAIAAYGITEEQIRAYGMPKHESRYGRAELEEWNDDFIDWLVRGMDKIAGKIK